MKNLFDSVLISMMKGDYNNFEYLFYYDLFNKFPDHECRIMWNNKTGKPECSKVDGIQSDNICNYLDRAFIPVSKVIKAISEIALTIRPCVISNDSFYVALYNESLIFIQDSSRICFTFILTSNMNDVDEIIKVIPACDIEDKYPMYYYVTFNQSFDTTAFTIHHNYNISIEENYNDDIPINELNEFCNKNDCGLILLYGEPGCGKTTIIKNLIYSNESVNFYLMDASILSDISNSMFLSFLQEHKHSVFILEDCEKILMDRNISNNPWIGTLLNLTDGMLGEGLSIRFICTFNTDLGNIDKALLREGRLDICYEFKKLSKEKSKALCDKLNKDCKGEMTLAEIYKSKINISSINKINKVGF